STKRFPRHTLVIEASSGPARRCKNRIHGSGSEIWITGNKLGRKSCATLGRARTQCSSRLVLNCLRCFLAEDQRCSLQSRTASGYEFQIPDQRCKAGVISYRPP